MALVTLLTLGALLLPTPAPSALAGRHAPVNPVNTVPASVDRIAQELALGLEEQSFETQSGYFKLYTPDDCADSYAVMRTCYGNNPSAPYVLPVLPYWPDEYRDPATKGAFGPVKEGHTVFYRLDPHEAILIMGVLPPPAAYFGLQSYLGNRTGEIDTENPTYKFIAENIPALLPTLFNTVPQDPTRVQLTASLSNSFNNVVIERQSGEVWDKMRFVIITPDQDMDAAIRANLAKSSISLDDVFTEPIPGSMRTGLGKTDDDFLTLIRYSSPAVESDGDAWRAQLPLVVLRIRPADRTEPARKYGEVSLETREAVTEKELATTLNHLAAAVLQKWEQPCPGGDCRGIVYNALNWQPPPINLVGPACVGNWMNCLGDTQDTVYHVTPAMPLDKGEIYAVAGPLGTRTGSATYVGLGLNSQRMKKGFDNLSDDQLAGTADMFASQAVTSTGKLYLYYFARDCDGLEAYTENNCLEISTEAFSGCPGGEGSEGCDHLSFSLRDYIKPGTQRGADATTTLPPKLIKLRRPPGAIQTHRSYLPLVSR
jgi:hypothetical protein